MSWNQDLFKTTLDFAARAHGAQTVPGSGAPYVVHLIKVTTEVLRAADGTFEVDLALQCALLHDCLEDAGITRAAIEARFGPRVAAGVSALTKDESLPKAERMADSLRRIQLEPREVWLVKLGDRITNLEPAPPHWSPDKRAAYRQEAQQICDALGSAHAGLTARLKEKISEYA
jgi:(p)ppGpp synthase/HD superfamily hydrolase